jgi:hypothetical protein
MGLRRFTVGELWGPFPCEVDGCREKECFTILLTDEENKSLPMQSGPEAVAYIFKHNLGKAECSSCAAARDLGEE